MAEDSTSCYATNYTDYTDYTEYMDYTDFRVGIVAKDRTKTTITSRGSLRVRVRARVSVGK